MLQDAAVNKTGSPAAAELYFNKKYLSTDGAHTLSSYGINRGDTIGLNLTNKEEIYYDLIDDNRERDAYVLIYHSQDSIT